MTNLNPQASSAVDAAVLRDDMVQLKHDIAQLKNDLRSLGRDLGDAARSGRAVAQDKIKEAVHAATAAGEKGLENVEESIKKHPLASVGIALGAGVVLGLLISRA